MLVVEFSFKFLRVKSGHSGYAFQSLSEDAGNLKWYFTPLVSLTTSEREFKALHNLKSLDEGMRHVILDPSSYSPPESLVPPSLIDRFFLPGFVHKFRPMFNDSQYSAIACVLTQMNLDIFPRGNTFPLNSSESGIPQPFTLIQGPPGTGKTHTIWGMLNVIYLLLKKQWVTSLVDHLDAEYSRVDCLLKGAKSFAWLPLPQGPKILVCAPSNTAVDGILIKVHEKKFVSEDGRNMLPAMIRVVADAQSAVAQVQMFMKNEMKFVTQL